MASATSNSSYEPLFDKIPALDFYRIVEGFSQGVVPSRLGYPSEDDVENKKILLETLSNCGSEFQEAIKARYWKKAANGNTEKDWAANHIHEYPGLLLKALQKVIRQPSKPMKQKAKKLPVIRT